jgi:regulatory protein YycI of two-component signal transduction system YycFG
MAVKKWKTIAIIFIILFVVETFLVILIYNKGVSMQDNRLKCSNEVCFNIDASAFIYDDYTNECTCYNGEEIIQRTYLK